MSELPDTTVAAVERSSRVTWLTILMRVMLGAMSIAGLLGWAYLILFLVLYYGYAILFGVTGVLTLLINAYLLVSVYVSLKTPRLKILAVIGAILNLPLVLYFGYTVSHIEDKLNPRSFVPLAFVLVWLLLWLVRWFAAKNVSIVRQFVTLGSVLVFVAAVAWAAAPAMVDPYSEAERLAQSGAQAANADEARRLFSNALAQANRIKNPYAREEPLRLIAYQQARAGLIQDAETTANQCATDTSQKIALNWIVQARVEEGDWTGALSRAIAYNSGSTLFMQLTKSSVERAKAGQIEEAKSIMRFAEQCANEPAFESIRRWSFGEVATAQAQLGLHDEALSSARKTGAEYAPEHMAFVAITEKQAGYPEQSRASVEEAIRAVLAVRTTPNSRDHTLYEMANHLSDGGLFDEARRVANAVNLVNTRELLLNSIASAEARQQR